MAVEIFCHIVTMQLMIEIDTTKGRDPEMLDPDVRFLLANERTLLAWLRTSLALVAGGLALTQLGREPIQVVFGIIAIGLSAMMAVLGYIRFRAADRAIRAAKLPSAGYGPRIQVASIVAFALVIAAIETTRI